MTKIEIYILTHKPFDEEYDKELYKPLLNGSASHEDDFGFLRDDTGDNISHLNNKFSELTGEYWAWKNSDADIYGFCHYRRWFVKNLKLDKLTKEDILNYLKDYDIILPKIITLEVSGYDLIKNVNETRPDYDAKYNDYKKLEILLKDYFPDYYQDYVDVMNSNYLFGSNMFICDRELANAYFEWLFKVFQLLEPNIDYSEYSENPRIYGFLSERLLTTFVKTNKLKVKECEILYNERKLPILQIIYSRFPKLTIFERLIYELLKMINLK